MAKYIGAPSQNGSGWPGVNKVQETAWARVHPALWEHLTLGLWDDGSVRETSTVLVFLQDGVLKACLRDRNRPAVGFVAGVSWEGLFESLEAALVSGKLDWRPDRPMPRKK